jgi:hypothetical protein
MYLLVAISHMLDTPTKHTAPKHTSYLTTLLQNLAPHNVPSYKTYELLKDPATKDHKYETPCNRTFPAMKPNNTQKEPSYKTTQLQNITKTKRTNATKRPC